MKLNVFARHVAFAFISAVLVAGESQAARSVSVDRLPYPVFADTEVSTNVFFRIDGDSLDAIRMTLECEASVTISLEVLLGRDADADGILSLDEVDVAFGYDCGSWFVRETATDSIRLVEDVARSGVVRREFAIRGGQVNHDWNAIRVIRRGLPAGDSRFTAAFENKKLMIIMR